MSMPNIPDLSPNIQIDRTDAINILLTSIGLEELSLSHIVNAEAEKIQYALGTLQVGEDENGKPIYSESLSPEEVLKMNQSAGKVLRDVIKNQMLLGMKLEEVVEINEPVVTTEPVTPIA
ncbi:MAG: hypothetical protein ACRC7V_05705 [Lachnospiraceae bacterium]